MLHFAICQRLRCISRYVSVYAAFRHMSASTLHFAICQRLRCISPYVSVYAAFRHMSASTLHFAICQRLRCHFLLLLLFLPRLQATPDVRLRRAIAHFFRFGNQCFYYVDIPNLCTSWRFSRSNIQDISIFNKCGVSLFLSV